MVGRDGFEPSKAKANRFTVCPIWPLWNLPTYGKFNKELFRVDIKYII